jgi:hypothetical protein
MLPETHSRSYLHQTGSECPTVHVYPIHISNAKKSDVLKTCSEWNDVSRPVAVHGPIRAKMQQIRECEQNLLFAPALNRVYQGDSLFLCLLHDRKFKHSQHTRQAPIAEMNRIHLVLFDTSNRVFGSYLAAVHRILISVLPLQCRKPMSYYAC